MYTLKISPVLKRPLRNWLKKRGAGRNDYHLIKGSLEREYVYGNISPVPELSR
ncbi:MAG: hypothetical protein GQ533_12535 [Methanosarcinaceae archaeon]|nr:hypothetical protein [Methanosarcinaceae archaeon]